MKRRKILAGGLAIVIVAGAVTWGETDTAYAKESVLQALESGNATVLEIDKLQEDTLELAYKPCLESLLETLPDTLTVTVSTGTVLQSRTEVEVPVTWECEEDYDESLGEYTFKAVMDDIEVEADMPTITVVTGKEDGGPVENYLQVEDAHQVQTVQSISENASLPSAYDTRENGDGLPALRDQSAYGTCWAFATIGALEADLIASDLADENIDLSELALAYFTNKGYDDPKDLHDNDTISSQEDYLNLGGNIYLAVNSLANNVGAVAEADVPYTWVSKKELDEALQVRIDDTYALSNNAATMVNYYDIAITDQDGIKTAIMDHGSVYAVMEYEDEYYSATHNSYYYNGEECSNHAIMLVGWNDNFPKENFLDDKDKPNHDGAWLVRNSWLDGSDEDNADFEESVYGYFWMSYEDMGVTSMSVHAFDVQQDGYDNCYAYDGAAGMNSHRVSNGAVLEESYPVDAGEEIEAVSVRTGSTDLTLDATVTAGEQSVTGSIETTYEGNYTIELEKKLIIDKDTNVTVQIVPTSKSGQVYMGGEDAVRMVDSDGQCLFFGYAVRGGKSKLNGRAVNYDWHIKLFTNTVDLTESNLVTADVTLDETQYSYTGAAFEPNVTVVKNDITLNEETDYRVSYKDNINAGTATVIVTGRGQYCGTVSRTFTILKADAFIKLAAQTKTYTGKTIAYTGKVTKSGSSGRVTYAYYLDAACSKPIHASSVKEAGIYFVKATLAADANYKAAISAATQLQINKTANTMKVSAVKKKVKYNAVKKRAIKVVCPLSVKRAIGKITYEKVSAAKCLILNEKTGKVTVKKGTKKGTYAIRIKVRAAGNANYEAASKTVKCKIIVK
ncbi:C1 family peptidase [Eubacterium oxidoreducens]|uniref:Cysteine protease, C1A family n=1 Tax=Eubacterium oxidoreducens TaxID=1732 RepID=A0A1G6AVN6_EUBOX|nr:C1 family peptidase [Eubacterium oxidoreducens]SDB12404.1 Cysteine protease, C1A family [Eubacterium oxidoreducens]